MKLSKREAHQRAERALLISMVIGLVFTLGVILFLDLLEQDQSRFFKVFSITAKHYGLPGVFFLIYLGSTLLPAPVDSIFLVMLKIFENVPVVFLVSVVASILGALTNYGVAFFLREKWINKMVEPDMLSRASSWFNKYGAYSLVIFGLFPVPIFDPLTFVAGLSEMDWKKFLVLTIIGKVLHFGLFLLLFFRLI